MRIHHRRKFPQRGCGYDGKEEEGTDRAVARATHEQQYIDGTRQGADDEVMHVLSFMSLSPSNIIQS